VKKLLVVLLLLVASPLYAQTAQQTCASAPATPPTDLTVGQQVKVCWDTLVTVTAASDDAPLSYKVLVDGNLIPMGGAVVDPIDATTGKIFAYVPYTLTGAGQHSLIVVAVNQIGETSSDPLVFGPVNRQKVAPGKPTKPKLTR